MPDFYAENAADATPFSASASAEVDTHSDLSPVGQRAVRYARDGVPVFPCNARKRPRTEKGFKDASVVVAQVAKWWRQYPHALIGAATGAEAGFWVLDADPPKDGREQCGKAELAALEERHGKLPKTLRARSPSGGLHLYFKWPAGVQVRTTESDVAPGIDARGGTADGASTGYIILPGSVRPDGAYRWEDDFEWDFEFAAPAPAWLLYLVMFSKSMRAELAAAGIAGPDDFTDPDPTTWTAEAERATRPKPAQKSAASAREPLSRIESALNALEPSGLDYGEWFRVGAALHQESGGAAWGLESWDRWSQRDPARYKKGECAAKWEGFGKKGGTPIKIATLYKLARDAGWREPTPLTPLPPDPQPLPSAQSKPYMCWADDATDGPEIEWLVDDVVQARGVGFLAGQSSAGKSAVALDLALCVGHGTPWFGRKIEKKGGTCIFAAEHSWAIGPRLKAARANKHTEIDRVPIIFPAAPGNLMERKTLDQFKAELVKADAVMRERYGMPLRLVIIDTFNRACLLSDENSAVEATKATAALSEIGNALGIAVLIIHHSGKDDSRGMRGSSALRAAADFVIEIEGKSGIRKIRIEKSRDAADGPLGAFELAVAVVGAKRDGSASTQVYVNEVSDSGLSGSEGGKSAAPTRNHSP